MEPQVGQLINNKYRLVRLIGDGGMGSVFEARHELLGTTVALKFLHAMLARRKGLVERFLQEAQVSARIKSIHVANVSDVDRTPEGLAYMVMEYVEGDTLQTVYENNYRAGRRMTEDEAFDIMLQMVEGVNAAHGLDIVHRDLKPDNVILSKDGKGKTLVKILDFGIAKLKASGEMDRGLTRPGVVMGTPEYMAPEQAFSADKVDARADVFSMGVMFFEMLAGRRPVGGDNAHAIAAQYLEGRVAKLQELAPGLAAPLCAAVHKAMAAEPEQRFDTVEEFRRAIAPYAPQTSGFDPLADTADSTLDPSLAGIAAGLSAVPKTQPPEDDAVEAADEGFEEPLETTDAARDAAAELRGATEGAGDPSGTMAMPEVAAEHLRAGTEPMPNGVATAQGLNEDGTPAKAGGTMVADGFVPPPYEPSGQTPPHETPVGPTGPTPGPVMATPEPRPGRRRKKKGGGASMFSILLIAAGVSAAVVGGIYVAQEVNGGAKTEDDGGPVVNTKKKKKADPEPDPEPQPVADPDPVPPPVDPSPDPVPQQPRPRPTQPRPTQPQPTQPQPTQPQPTQPQPPRPTTPVIPSTLPTFPTPPVIPSGFPFPGAIPPRRPVQPKPPPAQPTPEPKPNRPSYLPPRKSVPRPKAAPAPRPSPSPVPSRRRIPRVRRR